MKPWKTSYAMYEPRNAWSFFRLDPQWSRYGPILPLGTSRKPETGPDHAEPPSVISLISPSSPKQLGMVSANSRRTTRVIRIQYLGEEHAEGHKRSVDSLLERDARRGQRRVDHLGVEDVVKRENIRFVERFDLFGNPPSCSLGHGRPPCRDRN